MDKNDLDALSSWFSNYVRSFDTPNGEDRKNYGVKELHTAKVRENMAEICRGLGLDEQECLTAEAVALLHDVGRFPQYRDHKTFRDSDSVNHAALGAKVLMDSSVLAALPKAEKSAIIRAVTLHNVFELPAGLDGDVLLLTRLVRDADKLDIWRVFIDHFREKKENRASAVTLGLPDWPACSESVLDCLLQGRMAHLTQLRTQDDFKLLQLTWIYDLNFLPSFRMVAERKIIDHIAGELPEEPEILRAVRAVRAYVARKLEQSSIRDAR